jgi:hypothetical protein
VLSPRPSPAARVSSGSVRVTDLPGLAAGWPRRWYGVGPSIPGQVIVQSMEGPGVLHCQGQPPMRQGLEYQADTANLRPWSARGVCQFSPPLIPLSALRQCTGVARPCKKGRQHRGRGLGARHSTLVFFSLCSAYSSLLQRNLSASSNNHTAARGTCRSQLPRQKPYTRPRGIYSPLRLKYRYQRPSRPEPYFNTFYEASQVSGLFGLRPATSFVKRHPPLHAPGSFGTDGQLLR